MTPLESCGVCHSEGSFASAPAAHAVFDVASFDDFAVAAVGPDLVVSFSVMVDGAPLTDAVFGRAYVTDGTTRTSLSSRFEDPAPTAFFDGDNGDGTYSVTLLGGEAEFGGTDSRYLVVVEAGVNELEIAAVGDYPARDPARRPGQQRGVCWLATAPAAKLDVSPPPTAAGTTPRQ